MSRCAWSEVALAPRLVQRDRGLIPRRLRSSGQARTTARTDTDEKGDNSAGTDSTDYTDLTDLLLSTYAAASHEPGRCSFVTAHQSGSGAELSEVVHKDHIV